MSSRAWQQICAFGRYAPDKSRRRSLRRAASGTPDSALKYITAGLSCNSLVRIAAWATKLHDFLRGKAFLRGHAHVTPHMAADNALALDFLAVTADEDKGRTRVDAALRAINFVRAQAHWRAPVVRRPSRRPPPGRGALDESTVPPAPGAVISGALLLVPSRKSSQSSPSWVPIRHGVATEHLSAHVRWHDNHATGNPFLFPSRRMQRLKRRRPIWAPHESNPLSYTSLLTLMRQALMQVCGLSAQQASRFTVHSLRVGGINYYKRIGVSIGMRAQIASHKSLVTSRKYLRMLPVERLVELSVMADPS